MFGYWKRLAKRWEVECHRIADERDDARKERDKAQEGWKNSHELGLSVLKQLNDACDSLRIAKASVVAADLQFAAEKQHSETLDRKLKTAQAGLDHATRCYEQREADCQALAKERDELAYRVQLCDLGVIASQQERDAAQRKNDELTAALASAARAYTTATRDLERIHLISSEHVTEGTFATLEPTEAASVQSEPADEPEAQPDPHDPTWFGWGVSPAAEAKPAPRALGGFASITCVCDELGDSCLNPTNCSRAPRVVCPDTCPSPIAFGGSASITVAAADDPLYPDGP